jgi:AcrR family transcriptional regulator
MAALDIPKRATNSSVDETRRRLLDAAGRTFSRDGIQGATTREIAKEAGVNEVTLFRHFKSKEQLLGAVIEKGLSSELDLMNAQGSWAENFRENLTRYARHYYEHLEGKGAFARAIISEFRELPQSMQTMITNAVRPVRDRLIGILCDAQRAGVVRSDLDAECAIDALKNSLYAAVLRKSSCLPRNYTTDEYIDSVVDIFYRGLAA